MSINWFTVIAQVLNFLILVWLLKRYLYKPILKAIDERENKIKSQIEDAEKKEADAKKEREEFAKKNEDFDKQKKDLMDKALEEIKTKREGLLDTAKKDAEGLREKLEALLKEDQEHFGAEISRRAKTEVFSIAGKMLKELADTSLEDKIVTVFVERLKNLGEEENKKLVAAFNSSREDVIIHSAFELQPFQQTEIENTLDKILQEKLSFQFKTEPELISGIELNANGYKVSWSISEYLSSVKKAIDEVVNSKTKTVSES